MSITRQNLSVIIVSYKSDYVIENCINSINSEIEIVVVDNSNNDQLKEKIETKFKNVKYILSKENLGMGAGNNLGIKNVNKDFVLILNPDVTLEKSSIDEMILASEEIENFGIIAPLSDKSEYPNYTLKKKNDFDPIKPFKVKSVDGYAMLLNLKKLKKLNDFDFFDENFFLYLENEDLCLRLERNDENIYIVPKSRIHHLGGKAVDPKYKNEIEYLRNWHWMWSKFYFNKKHYGYLNALFKVFKNLISAKIKFFYYLITFNTFKRKIYQMRLLGLMSSMIGKNSYYRPKI
ncbi:glycosyltransferase family 2 protein [Candidatus Pelagibacter sp.]|uniref:glycosyltransferase family 2 protein n=1 Tax=Candidatus Pelagibacter sp. TaxID=2024849 RepID=UPI003F84C982